jgi:hypothetical protein
MSLRQRGTIFAETFRGVFDPLNSALFGNKGRENCASFSSS